MRQSQANEFSAGSSAPATHGDATGEMSRPAATWFRTREGHRYGWEIALIIAVKLVMLLVLWFAIIKPWTHPAASPSTVVRQLYAPTTMAPRND